MRGLLWFWGAVVGLAIVGASVLQMLGPLPPPPPKPLPAKVAPKPPPVRPAPPAPAPTGFLEPAPDLPGRMLPRIGPNGVTPAVAYAAPAPVVGSKHRIGLIVDGIGLDQALSERAIRALPRTIDLAFSAYTPDSAADRLGWDTRVAAHECFVSVPMEPAGFPLAEEGVHSLATSGNAARNQQNLYWSLSRISGCVGATGASDGEAGERFAASGPGFQDMLREIRKRGLLYIDPRPAAALPDDAGVRSVDLVIDKPPSADAPITASRIDARLAALEQMARERGSAIGIAGPPLPVVIDRIGVWAKGLGARGFVLVPVSALMEGGAAR